MVICSLGLHWYKDISTHLIDPTLEGDEPDDVAGVGLRFGPEVQGDGQIRSGLKSKKDRTLMTEKSI